MIPLSPRKACWLACLIAMLVAGTGIGVHPARGQGSGKDDPSTELAKKHFYRGEKLFALRRFKDALRHYEAAFEARPLPEFLFNIGQCHRNLGNFQEAIFSFRKYLKLMPRARNREQVEEYIRRLEKEQEKADRRVDIVPKNGDTAVRPPPPRTPIYKRWWFWTGVAAVAATGTAVLVLRDTGSDLPATDLGNLDFAK